MSTTIIALEGVLVVALQLYAALQYAGKVVLASNEPRALVEHWCRINGVRGYATVVLLSERSITSLRANGEDVGLYIDADPERAANALRSGVPTMLFSKPLYARASHRPDLPQLQRPWAAMVAESKSQRIARDAPVLRDQTYED